MIRPLLAAGLLALVAGPALAQSRPVQAGLLNCDVSGGIGLIVTSRKSMTCVFDRERGRREIYVGNITRFGLDIGATGGGQMVWAVYAPSTDFARGALAGEYVGASGEASFGAGLGANALVGGGRRSFALQPVSVQGQIGLNLAAGVASLRLAPARAR